MTSDSREALVDRLRRLIDRAQFRPGERLGTERGLSEALGVTRSAIRDALAVLEARGEVGRSMGRAGGVFASDGKVVRHLNTIQGVPEMLTQQGFASDTEVLRCELGMATPAEARQLALTAGAAVVRLTRRRDATGTPLSLDSMSLPSQIMPGFQTHDLSRGVYRLMQEVYGISPAYADETIDVVPASASVAGILGIAAGDPLFEIWRVTYDAQDRPIEFAHDLFRSDRTRISMQRYGARWKRVSSR